MGAKFSIILNAYDTDKAQRHMTMACLAAIRKFTDDEYEIIVVDNLPQWSIRDEFKVLNIDKYAPLDYLETVYESYNIGADLADTDYLFFIQSDVFVHEQCLNKLMIYLQEYEMVFPQQYPLSRDQVKEVYAVPDGTLTQVGQRDAGLMGITKEAFLRAGKWDGRFRNLLGEAAFYSRCDKAGVSWTDRTTGFISHIMAGNNLKKDEALYNEEMEFDALLLKEYS